MTEYTLTYQLTPEMLGRAMMSWDAPQPGRAGKRRKFVIATELNVLLFRRVLALLHYDILGVALARWLTVAAAAAPPTPETER